MLGPRKYLHAARLAYLSMDREQRREVGRRIARLAVVPLLYTASHHRDDGHRASQYCPWCVAECVEVVARG